MLRKALLGLAWSIQLPVQDHQIEDVVDQLLFEAATTDAFCDVEYPRTYLRKRLEWRLKDVISGEIRDRELSESFAVKAHRPAGAGDAEPPDEDTEADAQLAEELRWFRNEVIATIAASEKRRETREGLPKHVDGLVRIKLENLTIPGRAEEWLRQKDDEPTPQNLKKARTRLQKDDERTRERVERGIARLLERGELTEEEAKRAKRIAGGLLQFRKGRGQS